jgi:two-component system chemotaxis sensor kinase CheA
MALDMSKYLGLFVQEATEHLEAFGKDVVRLEREGHRKDVVDALFRHAHSVKGMSASMGFGAITALAHRAEDLVDRLRSRPEALTPELVDVLLGAGDRLLEAVRRAGAGKPPPDFADLEARLAAAVEAAGGGPAPARLGPNLLAVDVRLVADCPCPDVRAFLVHRRLAALGRVVRTTPSLEDCKAGRIPDGRFSLVVETEAAPDAVRRSLLLVSDLENVAVGPAPAAPEPPAAPPPRPAAHDGRSPSTVRVRTDRLDGFLEAVGELILATSRLRELGRALPDRERPPVEEAVDGLARIVKDLQNQVMAVRMTPVALVTDPLPRIARDLARQLGREVEVEIEGADIELDRAILEELHDPLTHLVRNCVDHGLEPPEERAAAGKPGRGRLSIRARRERDRVVVEIEDDGRGMDPERLKAAAVARGALAPEAARALSPREALYLALLPGVSTAPTVSDLSGRGVGMDAVKRGVEAVGGTLELDSAPGRGTRFVLRLPLTVAVVPLLLFRIGEELFGLPIAKVVGAVEADPARLDAGVDGPLLRQGDGFVPVHRLATLLGLASANGPAVRPHVVVEGGDGARLVALEVDRLVGQEEAVLKPVPAPLDRLPGLLGVTILGTGRPVFILDVPKLLAA